MKRLFFILSALVLALSAFAQQNLSFVIEGSEEKYNQIQVVNLTSIPTFTCRVVLLDDDNRIVSLYGEYTLNGYEDADSNTSFVSRGTKIGIQLPQNLDKQLTFSVQYKDYPIFDRIIIYLRDSESDYSDTF